MRKWILATLAVAGCGGTNGTPLLPDFNPPAAPSNGFQLVLPIVRGLMPGSDNELCTWTDHMVNQEINVKGLQAYQSASGHHVILYSTKVYQPAGTTRLCTDQDMTTFRFVSGAGGEGQNGVNQGPPNVAFKIPAGSQMVINQHFINATTKVRDGQSAVNVYLADPGVSYLPSGAVTLLNTDLHIPPGSYGLDIACTLTHDYKAWNFIPHMHEYGSHITISRSSTGSATPERMFDIAWDPSMTFHPPNYVSDATKPLLLKQGDVVKIHCDWNNTTQNTLTFGREMCVAFAQTIDEQNYGDLDCDNGKWDKF